MKQTTAFIFSDLHAQESFLPSIGRAIKKNRVDLIIFAGDFLNGGRPASFAYIFARFIHNFRLPFVWVTGNNDWGEGCDIFSQDFSPLEKNPIEFAKIKFRGLNYSPAISPVSKIRLESELAGSIFMTHVPPPGVRNYVWSESQLSPTWEQKPKTKSPKPKENPKNKSEKFANSPLIHICGHYHNQTGLALIGNTKIVKLGSIMSGTYAIMNLKTFKVEFMRLERHINLGINEREL